MLRIIKNKSLRNYTTLRLAARAEFFAVVKERADLQEAIVWAQKTKRPLTIIGGGSNLLISQPIKGLVLKNELRGISVLKKTAAYVLVAAESGESWAQFVDWTVRRGWHGLENLSLIYGTVGAAPMQNIGAYGAELKDSFHQLRAIELKTGREKIFSAAACRFGYRDSVFKNKLKGRYFIYSVTFKLKLRAPLRLDYGAIRAELAARGVKRPQLQDVAAAVKAIRTSKLPNPAQLPNAGSFFKNPEISSAKFQSLSQKYPQLPSWPVGRGRVKIPAAFLIEAAGFKGKKFGPVGMHERQALVLINYRGASAAQAMALVRKIKAAVRKRFGLALETEVNII